MDNVDRLFSKARPFEYKKYSNLTIIAIYFPKLRVAIYQELMSNIIQIISNPLKEPDNAVLDNINMNIIKTFEFSESPDTKENILLFLKWMQQNFDPKQAQPMKANIEKYIQQRYNNLLEEFVDLTEYKDLSALMLKIDQRALNFQKSWKTLSKQEIFELYYLRKAYVAISRRSKETNINESKFLFCSETYNEEKKGFNKKSRFMFFGGKKKRELSTHNYESIQNALDIIIESVKKAKNMYPSAKFLFIARDGIIFYESYLALYPTKVHNASMIYVSRDSLQNSSLDIEGHNLKNYIEKLPIFQYLVKEFLDPAIKNHGYGNVDAIILEVETGLRNYIKQKKSSLYQQITDFMKKNMSEYIRKAIGESREIIFFDSSSKTFPILLCAFMRIINPEKVCHPFFAITAYTDPKAGYQTGRSENYTTDFLSDIIRYNKKVSTLSPLTSKFTLSDLDCVANNFLIIMLFYNKMYSV